MNRKLPTVPNKCQLPTINYTRFLLPEGMLDRVCRWLTLVIGFSSPTLHVSQSSNLLPQSDGSDGLRREKKAEKGCACIAAVT